MRALSGCRVLIVEDEMLVGMLLEDMLTDLGCNVLAVAVDTAQAIEVAEKLQPIDIALLDLNLAGKPSYPVAEVLLAHGVPFAFATGYDVGTVDARFAGTPVIRKPFNHDELERLITRHRRSASSPQVS